MGWTARARRPATWLAGERPGASASDLQATLAVQANLPGAGRLLGSIHGRRIDNGRADRARLTRAAAVLVVPSSQQVDLNVISWCAIGLLALFGFSILWMRERGMRLRSQWLLEQRADLQRATLDAISDPIYLEDARGNFLDVNRAYEEYVGLERRELMPGNECALAQPSRSPSHPLPWPERWHGAWSGNTQLGSDACERRFRRSTRRLRLADGRAAWVGRLTDVTELAHARATCRTLEQRQLKLGRMLPGVIFHFREEQGSEGRFAYVAGAVGDLFGSSAAQWMANSQCPLESIHPEDRPAFDSRMATMLGAGPLAQGEFRTLVDGKVTWLRAHVSEVVPGESGCREWVGCWLDVTDYRAAVDASRTAEETALHAAEARIGFLALMSHEIRTPMNGVLGTLELLDHSQLDGRQRGLVQVAGESSRALLRIIDDILDFSKIEAGRMTIEKASFDPREAVDAAIALLLPHARDKGLTVQLHISRSVAPRLLGDSIRLRQILYNLVGNAIKFTSTGTVRVKWLVCGESGDGQEFEIRVADTGVGIAPERQVGLFEPFFQAEASTVRRYGGTGLGLAIVHRLCGLLGFSLHLHSASGQGTEVRVRGVLPVDAADTQRGMLDGFAVGLQIRPGESVRALEEHLHAMGAQVTVLTPRDNIAELDLLFCDEEPAAESTPPLIRVVSGSVEASAHEKSTLRMDPPSWIELQRVLEAVVSPAATAPQDVHLASYDVVHASEHETMQRILVVEDHPLVRDVLGQQLERLGWSFDMASDGEEALVRMAGQEYALLITDCHMPGIDGYELARRIRSMESGRRIPIIALTASVMPDQIRRCMLAGMDDVMPKPLRLKTLGDKVGLWLRCENGGVANAESV